MKDFSLFLLKNSLAAKMKRGIRSFCSSVGSTSTLNQMVDQDVSCIAAPPAAVSYMEKESNPRGPITLEQMLLQVELEEAAARRAELVYSGEPQRMSCVNDSDIMRSARNALNRYPRFSLDGRDAMYRSSFQNFGSREGGRRSVCCSGFKDGHEVDMERDFRLPSTVAGENVVWCKPGVVAKLMGLDAVPVGSCSHGKRRLDPSPVAIRKENLRRMGRNELERERFVIGMHGCKARTTREALGSANPICIGPERGRGDWRFHRAR